MKFWVQWNFGNISFSFVFFWGNISVQGLWNWETYVTDSSLSLSPTLSLSLSFSLTFSLPVFCPFSSTKTKSLSIEDSHPFFNILSIIFRDNFYRRCLPINWNGYFVLTRIILSEIHYGIIKTCFQTAGEENWCSFDSKIPSIFRILFLSCFVLCFTKKLLTIRFFSIENFCFRKFSSFTVFLSLFINIGQFTFCERLSSFLQTS